MTELKHKIGWSAAWNNDPDPKKEDPRHGDHVHGGAFEIDTGWYLFSDQERLRVPGYNRVSMVNKPLGFVFTHQQFASWIGQRAMDDCQHFDGPCYSDSYYTMGETWAEQFVAQGIDWLWNEMDQFHQEIFNNKEQSTE